MRAFAESYDTNEGRVDLGEVSVADICALDAAIRTSRAWFIPDDGTDAGIAKYVGFRISAEGVVFCFSEE